MGDKKKLIYLVSDVSKSLAFEWTATHLQNRFDLFFILIGSDQTPLSVYLLTRGIRHVVISDAAHPSMVRKLIAILGILRREHAAIVHIHLWRAMLLGLPAAWLLRVPKRIFTRHHATIHYKQYPSGLKWDKLCNALATDIVAISDNIREILVEWEKVPSKKVHLIHHGFDLPYFYQSDTGRVARLRSRLGLEGTGPVIGVIARYTEWKGIQFTIEAFGQVLKQFPDARLVLANANGDYGATIKGMLAELPAGSYREIVFEDDLSSLYRLFDVFVHVPVDRYAEAFGQTYVEALAAGIPAVFTPSGIACEFIVDGQNALMVDFKDAPGIADSLIRLLGDSGLREKLVEGARLSVKQFELKNMLNKLDELYG